MQSKHFQALIIAVVMAIQGYGQQVGINEDGSLPDPNAILDIKSLNKGVLISRMSSANRQAIPNVKGLLVYDTTTNSFWYNTGTAWQDLTAGSSTGTAWSIIGNSGTNDSNFLGTLDFAPLRIRVLNKPSGLIDSTSHNTFWGFYSGSLSQFDRRSRYNSGFGDYALTSNTSGYRNTAIGASTLQSNTRGFGNTAIGDRSMEKNKTGILNTAIGEASLLNNQTGYFNTACGTNTLTSNDGIANTAMGASALFLNTTGMHNTSTGYIALSENGGGTYNTANGSRALENIQSGHYNTGVGAYSLQDVESGAGNTTIGAYSTMKKFSTTNSTAIGFFSFADKSNKIRLGNNAITAIEGAVSFTTPSDGRYKFQVQEDVKGLDFILQLRPVTYQFDVKKFDEVQHGSLPDSVAAVMKDAMQDSYAEATALRRSGFIAQEVEKAVQTTGYDFSGLIIPKDEKSHYSLSYESFVVPLVKGMQEQQHQIAELQQQVKTLLQLLKQSK